VQYLSDFALNTFISLALAEDVGEGDHSSLASIPPSQKNEAYVLCKGNGVVAGIGLAERILLKVDPETEFKSLVKDGDPVREGQILMEVSGKSQSLLKAERLLLNCMQRMSGIATYTGYMKSLIEGTGAKLLDTRKTTPNFRMLEKWAVLIGGGTNHRYNLADMVMLKDNHIDSAGGMQKAVESTRNYLKAKDLDLKVEVETRNLEEVRQALSTGMVDRIMFDNFALDELEAGVKMVSGEVETEASGGVTEETIAEIAKTGVDYISVGALTHSYTSLDISMKIK
jgi:nicotinate-nucleotide pyrophosphorylase (carboxylating)